MERDREVLGPVEVRRAGGVPVAMRRLERTLLATLVLHAKPGSGSGYAPAATTAPLQPPPPPPQRPRPAGKTPPMNASSHAAVQLCARQARVAAVTASGLTSRATSLPEVLARLVVVQLDTINVLARAHQLTLAARLPTATAQDIDQQLWSGTAPVAYEAWGHAASLIPIVDWPLWAFRRRAARRDKPIEPQVRQRILATLRDTGPQTLRQLRGCEAAGSGWAWGPTKLAVARLIWTGELVCVTRRGWQRLIDLPERAIPDQLLTDVMPDQECLIRLIRRAGDALGVATPDDLADYLRIKAVTAATVLPDTGLVPVTVQGWPQPAWASPSSLDHHDRTMTHPPMFLGPFDNLIWYRKRVRRLFAFDHTLEAYKPAANRRYGYYACPLLLDHTLIGRADLATNGNTLEVRQEDISTNPPDRSGFSHACQQLMALTQTTDLKIAPPTA
jgi:hypothetical protein